MEQEIEQLRILVGDLFSKIESLEERLSILEDERAEAPKGPEPILTCVQCMAEYKESENADGYCKYHTGNITYNYSKVKVSCCNATNNSEENVMQMTGCVKGKHHSKHHIEYHYTNYVLYMRKLSNSAELMWLEMDLYDYVTESCQWAEVGLTKENTIFVLAGAVRNRPDVCATLKPEEFKKHKKSSVLFEKCNDAGWFLKAELIVTSSKVEGILVTLKTSWSKTPFVKKLNLIVDGTKVKPGEIETISDPTLEKPSIVFTVPEESKTGPILEAGEDYTKGRKNDYPTVTNDDMFALEMKQVGSTAVDSNTWGMRDNKWDNHFTANIEATNGSLEIVEIMEILGEYQNTDGEWIKCDKVYVGLKGERDFMDTTHFLVDTAAPISLVVRLVIKIEDPRSPNDNQERARAHHSLPQPLLLRATLVDKEKRAASLIFEQGNPPLPLATKEKRQENWAKKRPLLFHLFADDTDLRKRSDIAIYHDDELNLIYRPAPNNNGSSYYYLRRTMVETLAYKAKKSGVNEQELTGLRSENQGSKVEVFGVVDLDSQYTFALKVVITTPTSSATGYYLLPNWDGGEATVSVEPTEVEVGTELTVMWNVPNPSKSDRIRLHKEFGNNYIISEGNRKELKEGAMKVKAPGSPGEYEARYYPRYLDGPNTGFRHSLYVAAAKFTVVTA